MVNTGRASVFAVSLSAKHSFSKYTQNTIRLIAGIGVEGDAHAGKTVKHRYFAKQDPTRPNILQVHLIAYELLAALSAKGFAVSAGVLGENITTTGIQLLDLPLGTRLLIGDTVVVELTALRKPCTQIENFQTGLLNQLVDEQAQASAVKKLGVMGIVVEGGEVYPGDAINIQLPSTPHKPLDFVW